MSTKTLALIRRCEDGIHCSALCLQSDYDQLHSKFSIKDHSDTMPEEIFCMLYERAYNDYLRSDMIWCISIWIEKFYDQRKDYHIDENAIFTESYNITVNKNSIMITLYIGCSALEAARFVLYLKEHVGDAMTVEVDETTMLSDYSQN